MKIRIESISEHTFNVEIDKGTGRTSKLTNVQVTKEEYDCLKNIIQKHVIKSQA